MSETTTVVKKAELNPAEVVLVRVNSLIENGTLDLPRDYSAANAIRAAYLTISQMTDAKTGVPITQVCTKDSIITSLFNMTCQGLNPAKRQCSFIQYGNQLRMQREYAGSIALAKRYGGLKEINGVVVYGGDKLEVEIDGLTGRRRIKSHTQDMNNINIDNIKGAYAVMTFEDGSANVEIMTMPQIRKSWAQGAAKGESPAHKNFPDQMAIKTVINRACKLLIASSDDSVLMEGAEETRPAKQITESAEPMQVIDIPAEEPQVAEEVKPEADKPKGREWKKEETTTETAPF